MHQADRLLQSLLAHLLRYHLPVDFFSFADHQLRGNGFTPSVYWSADVVESLGLAYRVAREMLEEDLGVVWRRQA